MNPFSFIGDCLRAIGAIFGYAKQRSEQSNTPEMKKADQCKKDIQLKNDVSKEVQDCDEEAIRRRISP